jgi:hypothetical protein
VVDIKRTRRLKTVTEQVKARMLANVIEDRSSREKLSKVLTYKVEIRRISTL